MWQITRTPIPHDWLEFEPETIIDEYDAPMLFTLRDSRLQKYIAYFCGRDANGVRFLVSSFNESLLKELLAGEIDLREALVRPQMWIFDLDKKWNPVRCWKVSNSDLPSNLLPKPGVMLRAGMKPVTKFLTLRSITSETHINITIPNLSTPIKTI